MRKIDQVLLTMKASGLTKKQLSILEETITQVFCPSLADIENQEVLDRFISYLKFRNYSEKTITCYKSVLISLSDFSQNRFVEMTRDDIQSYLETKSDLTPSSINGKLSAFKSLFKWMYRNDLIIENPTLKVERVKEPKVVQEAFSPVDIEKLRAKCEVVYKEDKCHRTRALIEFMLSTMCRVSEICKIKIGDVNFAQKKVKVLGKGNKERFVYYDSVCENYLMQYLSSRSYTEDDYLFTSLRSNEPLQECGIRRLTRALGDLADVEDSHPHKYRRTGASEKSRRGATPVAVKELLGHANISTTSRYIVTDSEAVRAEFFRAS